MKVVLKNVTWPSLNPYKKYYFYVEIGRFWVDGYGRREGTALIATITYPTKRYNQVKQICIPFVGICIGRQ